MGYRRCNCECHSPVGCTHEDADFEVRHPKTGGTVATMKCSYCGRLQQTRRGAAADVLMRLWVENNSPSVPDDVDENRDAEQLNWDNWRNLLEL